MKQNLTSGYLSSAQAADDLGVTAHQIAMLAKTGEVRAFKEGGVLLVDPYSLRAYKNLRCGRGRPFGNEVAWGTFWELSGLEPSWLDQQQRSRIATRLKSMEARALIWQSRKRSELHVFHVDVEHFPALRKRLILSGKSTDRPEIFGMPRNDHEVEGYATTEEVLTLEEEYSMREDITGNVLIRVLEEEPWEGMPRFARMPVAVIAADLATSLDPREAHAGIAAMEILLEHVRNNS